MSDANRVSLAFVEETTFGTTPSGPPTLKALRFTSESFKQDTQTTISQEVRSDRQIADLVRNSLTASGELGIELSYDAYDLFLEAALMSSDWSTPSSPVTATTISFQDITAGGGTAKINDSGNGLAGFAVGEWVKVTGAASAANNVYCKVTASAAGSLSVIVASSTGDFVTAAAGPSVTITQGAYITNGTELRSFSIERKYEDLSNEFEVFKGMCIDAFNLAVGPDAIITGSFGFIGKSAASGTATVGSGSNTAAASNAVMNGIDNVTVVLENHLVISGVSDLSLALRNNLRNRLAIGTLGPVSIGSGTVDMTGNLEMYFASKTLMDKYRNFTATKLAIVFAGEGGAYCVDFPRVKYSDGKAAADGINTDVMAQMPFTAFRDPTANYTIRISKFVG